MSNGNKRKVSEIVKRYLYANKLNGLKDPYSDCACKIDNLMNCSMTDFEDCKAATVRREPNKGFCGSCPDLSGDGKSTNVICAKGFAPFNVHGLIYKDLDCLEAKA